MASISPGRQESGLAGILFEEMNGDFFPSSLLVREAFGFMAMKTHEDETKLLGVYQGLKQVEAEDWEVEQWRKTGTLRESILKFYDDHYGPSAYFSWFKKTKYVLEKASDAGKSTKTATFHLTSTDHNSREQ